MLAGRFSGGRPTVTTDIQTGTLLDGPPEIFRRAVDAWSRQAVDWDATAETPEPYPAEETTIDRAVTVRGPGTFFGRELRTLVFEPHAGEGWWFDRSDRPMDLPTRVSVRNVWTTGQMVSNIVLRSGDPHNYIRMVEHIIALRLGLGLDNLTIRLDSGDPPLFDRGSLDLVEALENAEIVPAGRPARYVTVREPVSIVSPGGAFVTLRPCVAPTPRLTLDAAIDFPTAIGKQRLRFHLDRVHFRMGAVARTNTSAVKKLYCQTIGRLFADIRHLGYSNRNLLIAGRSRYWNEPRLPHNGRSLEAGWHRAVLDLLAALALIDEGRFVGEVVSYKAGHALDVRLITLLYRDGLLAPFPPGAGPGVGGGAGGGGVGGGVAGSGK